MTGVREFLLPDVGEGLEEATIVAWLVAVGDPVAVNQPLCVIETAKAEVELPCPFAGTLVARSGEPGESLLVGSVLARVDTEALPAGNLPVAATAPDNHSVVDAASASEPAPTAVLVGYGVRPADGLGRRRDRQAQRAAGRHIEVLAKPPVRKLARDLGVDLAALAPGTGPDNRITREDVLGAARLMAPPIPPVARANQDPALPSAPPVSGASGLSVAGVPVGAFRGAPESRPGPAPGDVIPLTGIRARIAGKMALANTEIPAANCAVWADCTNLLRVRDELQSVASSHGLERVTPFTVLVRLIVEAVKRNPLVNSYLDTETNVIRVAKSIHLGVAAATERGLTVVVVRDAEQRSLLNLAHEIQELTTAARAGRATPAQLTGSTFTISNFGSLDLDEGTPIINHPEAAILGLGAMRPRAVVLDGEVVARPTVRLSCTFDHRILDGADAGRFLSDLRGLVEEPALALLTA